jgi:hexosaminidase
MGVRWEGGRVAQSPAPASLERAFARFHGAAFPHPTPVTAANGGTPLAPILSVAVRDASAPLQLGVSEAYKLDVPAASAGGNITITADTQVGVFRALETLAQLAVFDFDTQSYGILDAPVKIDDAPRFPHREILMDSARHFLPVPTIKELLKAMAINKLNTLHWHLVDLQSFPFIAPRAPELASAAAFSPQERYTPIDVKSVVAFAADLGIRVVVEVDVPGHTLSFCRSHPEVCPQPSCGEQNALAPHTNATFNLIEKIFAVRPPSPPLPCLQNEVAFFLLLMRFPLIGQNRSIFIGDLRLFWIYFYRLMGNAS